MLAACGGGAVNEKLSPLGWKLKGTTWATVGIEFPLGAGRDYDLKEKVVPLAPEWALRSILSGISLEF